MYQLCYDEITEDSTAEERDREHAVFTESIRLLEEASSVGAGTPVALEALSYVDQLWMILIEDLGQPANLLPEATRAALISIGIWVLKEVERIRRGQSNNFKGIASINAIIRDGLN